MLRRASKDGLDHRLCHHANLALSGPLVERVCWTVGVTLNPASHNRSAFEDGVPTDTGHGHIGAGKIDILKDQHPAAHGNTVLRERGDNARGSVGYRAVEQKNGANCLILRRVGHIETDLAVVDGDGLEGPGPVPVHENSRVAVVEAQVAGGELLVANEHAVVAAIEGQVGHETTGAVVHEDTLLLVGVAASPDHLEADVLQAGCLTDLPVDTSTAVHRHGPEVDDKVANGAEEVVLVGVPIGAVILVRVGVNHRHACKVGGCFDHRKINGITDYLSVVILDDGLRDNVCTGRKVNQSGSGGGGIASFSAPIPGRYGLVDRRSIIGYSVTYILG